MCSYPCLAREQRKLTLELFLERVMGQHCNPRPRSCPGSVPLLHSGLCSCGPRHVPAARPELLTEIWSAQGTEFTSFPGSARLFSVRVLVPFPGLALTPLLTRCQQDCVSSSLQLDVWFSRDISSGLWGADSGSGSGACSLTMPMACLWAHTAAAYKGELPVAKVFLCLRATDLKLAPFSKPARWLPV